MSQIFDTKIRINKMEYAIFLGNWMLLGQLDSGQPSKRRYFTTTAPSGSVISASVAIKRLLPGVLGVSGHSGT